MPLLSIIVSGNGAWCATVAGECAAGASLPGLSAMSSAASIFGAPLYPDAAEHVNILVLQDQMRGPGDLNTSHLGEAETITIITSRQLSAAFVTDDRDAARHASSQGIATYSTWHILKLAVATGHLSLTDFHVAYAVLVAAGRGHPPCSRNRASVETWLST